MNKIKEYFQSISSGILIPEDDLMNKRSGIIKQNGWVIRYTFGIEDAKNYMEYYASHRMTDDRHYRIYEDGEIKQLESIQSWFFYPKGATIEQIKEEEKKYFQRNREILKSLEDIFGERR